MNFKPLSVAILSVALLSACSLFSGPKGPQPSPLPQVRETVTLERVWRARTGSLEGSLLRPALVDGSIYAGARSGDLMRLDLGGRELWQVRSVRNLVGGVAVGGQYVAVGSSDGVVAVHDAASGRLLWQAQTGGEVFGTPYVGDDLVVVRVGDNQLIAYAAADGKRLWAYQRAQSPLSLRAYTGIVRSGDMLLAGFSGGKLVALTAAGGVARWETVIANPRGSNELERMTDVAGDPVVRGDTICVAAFQGRVACVERDRGSVQWTRDYSSAQGVAVAASTVYVTDATGTLYAMDAQTGATIWKQDKLQYRGVGLPVVLEAGIAVADSQGWVHLLDAGDGHFIGQSRVDSSGVAAPMLALPSGGLLVQARDGSIYALAARR